MNIVHTVACRFQGLKSPNVILRVVFCIFGNKVCILQVEITIDILLNRILIATWLREVKPQHLILVTLGCGMAAHIRITKQEVKVILGLDVIIRLHHRQEHALAEAAWTCKEKEVSSPLHTFEIHGLVDHIQPLALYLHIIGYAIRQQFIFLHDETPLF